MAKFEYRKPSAPGKFRTHKETATGKAETLVRRSIRSNKYAVTPLGL